MGEAYAIPVSVINFLYREDPMPVLQKTGLTGNQLKIIAMAAMTLDHVGLLLFPQEVLFRILGRLAMPIYAYMIAEGCRYTHDRRGYFLRLLGLGGLCQIVYFITMGSLYQCILITFSLSVALIYLADRDIAGGRIGTVRLCLGVFGVFFLCVILPDLLPGTDFAVDYGIWGVMLPVFVYFGTTKEKKILLLTVGLCLLGFACGGIQWFGLAAVPLLALYNGQRGKANIGKFFYIYYPAHLVVLYGFSMVL